MLKNKVWFKACVIFLLHILLLYSNQPQKLNYTLKDLKSNEKKIKLNLLREWGGENAKDEALYFFYPYEVKINKNNMINILDTGNCRIQIFSNSGKFVRTIGRKGQGPGDFLYPTSFDIDPSGNLIVAEDHNRRIQILSSEGEYISSFKINEGYPGRLKVLTKNRIIIHNPLKSFKSHSLLDIYNYKGKILKEIGKFKGKSKSIESFGGVYFALDKYDNIYVAYTQIPLIEVYSDEGELAKIITFEMPFHVDGIRLVNSGIAIDKNERLYTILTTRPQTEMEILGSTIVSVSKKGVKTLVRNPIKPDSVKTDLYRLIILDRSGKIIASKVLDVFCNDIYVNEDKIYIIDACIGMKIYEYKINFEPFKK